MKKTLFYIIILIFSFGHSIAQKQRGKIAVFTPLYLDEAFDQEGNYKFNKKTFPNKSIQGLEFYQGVSIATDSLSKTDANLDVYIYDSKSSKFTLDQQFNRAIDEGVQLVIANISIDELKKLAPLAYKSKVTLINATVPNDANAVGNPYYVIINPTLQTLVEKMYLKLSKDYNTKTVYLCSRLGDKTDKMIADALIKWNQHNNNKPVVFKSIQWKDTTSLTPLFNQLKTEKNAVIVSTSLDTKFGDQLLKSLARKNAPGITVYGFPTWESLDLSKKDYKGLTIIYSTPFYNNFTSPTSKDIQAYYAKNMFARPSDLVFRGFALTYKYGRLLNKYGDQFTTNMNNKEFIGIYDFDIQPVLKNGQLNYFENKKLSFLNYLDGNLIKVD